MPLVGPAKLRPDTDQAPRQIVVFPEEALARAVDLPTRLREPGHCVFRRGPPVLDVRLLMQQRCGRGQFDEVGPMDLRAGAVAPECTGMGLIGREVGFKVMGDGLEGGELGKSFHFGIKENTFGRR